MKTLPHSKLFISIMTLVSLSGCQSLYYAPNAQNVPLFKEKKEARISAAYTAMGDDSEINGYEIQTAYAAGKHFAIMFNGFKVETSKGTNSYDAAVRHQKGNLIEFGAGYFKSFAEDKFVVEAYGGFGGGKFENRDVDPYNPTHTLSSTANFKRYFVQPSIGFSSPHFGAAFSLRLAILKYDHQPEIYYGTSYFLVEPCFTVRAGWKGLKFQSQIQFSNNVFERDFPQHHLNFNTGICLTIPVKKTIE